jgi:hypothetical protein
MFCIGRLFPIFLVSLLGACATPQAPILFNHSQGFQPPDELLVSMATIPAPDTSFPGADCLLCLAAASMGNQTLTAHVKTLSAEDLGALKPLLADAMRKKGFRVKLDQGMLDLSKLPKPKEGVKDGAKEDFTTIATREDVRGVLVIQFREVGVNRPYQSYIPVGSPYVKIKAIGRLIDRSSNQLKWYQEFEISRQISGAWDQPPNYPNLTNAHYEAIELAKEAILQAVKN